MNLNALRCALRGVSAYRNMLDQPEMVCFNRVLDAICGHDGEAALEAYSDLFFTLRKGNYASLSQWLHDKLRYEESPYPIMLAERRQDEALRLAAENDIRVFMEVGNLKCEGLIKEISKLLPQEGYRQVVETLPKWSAAIEYDFDSLTEYYDKNGAGIFSRYRAFQWCDGKLYPIEHPDCPKPVEMIGYRLQREQVISNTKAMIEGNLVNNVLLFGNSGTGKSATVKSLLQIPGFEDLRLVEVQKESLNQLPDLIRLLNGKRHKFILFIDDLAFDSDDRTYSALKTILEGGLEPRPNNVAIYATSNRRNLVRQTFSDRAGDEVDKNETIEEKTSLADRFGLRIPYLNLNKAEYLALVDAMADQKGIQIERDELHRLANIWEIRHSGRNPRAAKQFIQSLSAD